MDEAVDALEVHEGPEVDDVRNLAFDDLAGLEALEDLLADLLALLFEDGAAREDDVVARAVELDHLALEGLVAELLEVVDAADVDERRGQEAADAEVEDQAALDDLDHGALDGLAGLGGGLDLAPGLLEAGALLGEDEAPLLVLLGEDESVDDLAQIDLVGGIHGAADRQLVSGNDAFGLVADVDQDLVLVDPDDLAVDDVALLERLDRRRVIGHELAVDLDHEVVRSRSRREPRRQGRSRSQAWTRLRSLATGVPSSVPTRSTKRGADRTPLSGDYDVIVCGASFAGLTVARQLTGSGARVLLLDRYDVGERQTSACGIPTAWLRAMGLMDSFRQEFGSLVVHTPHGTSRYDLPWTFLDLRLPDALPDPLRGLRRGVRDGEGRGPRRRGTSAEQGSLRA